MPEIELKKIQPNRLNPRLEFRKQALDELADSIRQVGLLEPIIVRPKGNDAYEVVVGERRYRAAHQAGLDCVPAIVRDYTDEEVLEINFIENAHREDLTAVEKGKLCQQLLERFPQKYPSVRSLAQILGIDHSVVVKWLTLIETPEEVQRLVKPRTETRWFDVEPPKPKIDYETAYSIATRIKEPQKQIEVAQQVAQRHLPTRIAREVVKKVGQEPQRSVQQVIRQVIDEAPLYLPFSKIHADAIVQERKTQTSRKGKDPRLQVGSVVRAQVTYFADLEVTDVLRKRLGDFDEEDARREGGYTLDEFKEVWQQLHGAWKPNEVVYVIRFRPVKVIGEESL